MCLCSRTMCFKPCYHKRVERLKSAKLMKWRYGEPGSVRRWREASSVGGAGPRWGPGALHGISRSARPRAVARRLPSCRLRPACEPAAVLFCPSCRSHGTAAEPASVDAQTPHVTVSCGTRHGDVPPGPGPWAVGCSTEVRVSAPRDAHTMATSPTDAF